MDPRPRRGAGHHARAVREEHAPHPRAGRRHPQGRPVGGHHHGHGDGQRAHRHPGPQGRRDDRRDHAAWSGAADRRPQEQDPGRAPVGCRSGDPAAEEREGPASTSREEIRKQIKLVLVESMDQVLEHALVRMPQAPRGQAGRGGRAGRRDRRAVAGRARQDAPRLPRHGSAAGDRQRPRTQPTDGA